MCVCIENNHYKSNYKTHSLVQGHVLCNRGVSVVAIEVSMQIQIQPSINIGAAVAVIVP